MRKLKVYWRIIYRFFAALFDWGLYKYFIFELKVARWLMGEAWGKRKFTKLNKYNTEQLEKEMRFLLKMFKEVIKIHCLMAFMVIAGKHKEKGE